MLEEVAGDILLSKAQVIAHGVAPGDHFNQGLALALRERYPAMARDFRHYCQLHDLEIPVYIYAQYTPSVEAAE